MQDCLEPLPYVHALWEGGSAAFGRLDELSDLDLMIDSDAGEVEAVVALLDHLFAGLSPAGGPGSGIARRFRLPEPTWHGHTQVLYELHSTGPYLMLDVVVLKHGEGQRFAEREQHGTPIVYFDKSGVVEVTELDWDLHAAKLGRRVEELSQSFPLFQSLVRKEIRRRDDLAALGFYQGLTIRPLVELLRIIHDPARPTFHLRYLKHDLPPNALARLQGLSFVSDLTGLAAAHEAACAWFDELLPVARAKWGG